VSGEPFGYFSAPRSTTASSTPGSVGAPPAPAPQPKARPRRGGGRPAQVLGLALVLLVVVAAGLFGKHVWDRLRPVQLPAAVDGMPLDTDPSATRWADLTRGDITGSHPGLSFDVQVYGRGADRMVLVGAARSGVDTYEAMSGLDPRFESHVQTVGADTCTSSPSDHATICGRSEGELQLAVLVMTTKGLPTGPETAAILDEVWPQL
jgi:hypothetical protein